MKKLYSICAICLFAMGFVSCSDNQETASGRVEPGKYVINVNLGSNTGSTTRGFAGDGSFNAAYDASHIYIHSTDGQQTIGLPVAEHVVSFELEVAEDQSYTISSSLPDVGENVKCNVGETVYFSSIEERNWKKPEVDVDKKISDHLIIYKRSENNVELYRSGTDYNLEALIALNGAFTMQRVCAAFDSFVLFTDRNEESGGNNHLTETEFVETIGDNPNKWYVKMYVGPSFSGNFNMATQRDESGLYGYYVTNLGKYASFELTNQNSVAITYEGYGYKTPFATPLITPFDLNGNGWDGNPRDRQSLYIYIKHWTESGEPNETWLTDDTGAKYTIFEGNAGGASGIVNNGRYNLGLAIDIMDLHDAFLGGSGPQTKSISGSNAQFELKNPTYFFEKVN